MTAHSQLPSVLFTHYTSWLTWIDLQKWFHHVSPTSVQTDEDTTNYAVAKCWWPSLLVREVAVQWPAKYSYFITRPETSWPLGLPWQPASLVTTAANDNNRMDENIILLLHSLPLWSLAYLFSNLYFWASHRTPLQNVWNMSENLQIPVAKKVKYSDQTIFLITMIFSRLST